MKILSFIAQRFALIVSLLLAISGFAQPVLQPTSGLATDFEWELQRPNRTLFRDRIPVGKIALRHLTGSGGMLGKKGKETGESLLVQADVAFVPGDSLRYHAATIALVGSGEPQEAVVDAYELPALYSAIKYMLGTAGHVIDTERPDTRIEHRTKSGLVVGFYQQLKVQRFAASWPGETGARIERGLEADQFQSLQDLLDLTMFELRRQGAAIGAVVEVQR